MKIAIPTTNKDDSAEVCVSFGRAPYFLIYNVDTDEKIYLENTAAESAGGAGIKAAQIIADSKVDALITPRCGENAADVLIQSEVKLLRAEGSDISKNISLFKENKLSRLSEIHGGYHKRGGNKA